MNLWQALVVAGYGIFALFALVMGYYKCKNKKAFQDTPHLYPLGVFVWGDAVVFGIFWVFIVLAVIGLNDWLLFMFTISVFWLIRSLGETIYWFNEQFASKTKNPPQTLLFYKLFHDDSVWFVYQIFWQCITIISIITTIYFSNLWLKTI